jgi:hypothetical protein
MRKQKFFKLPEYVVTLVLILIAALLAIYMMNLSLPSPPPTSIKVIDETLIDLEWGNVVFNAPKSMHFKETKAIELLLSPSVSVKELQTQMEIQISNRMEAQLLGNGFQVEAHLPKMQAIGSEGVAKWRWDVTAIKGGSQRLHLTLSAILVVSGHDTPYVVRTYDRYIDVEITFTQRFSSLFLNNWKWLWAAVLIPVTGYFWRRHKKKMIRKPPRKSIILPVTSRRLKWIKKSSNTMIMEKCLTIVNNGFFG